MRAFQLTVSSPDGNLFSGKVLKLDVRGVEGELAVMAGHVPFVTSVLKAPITILTEEGETLHARSDGGLLTVGTDRVNYLSGTFSLE